MNRPAQNPLKDAVIASREDTQDGEMGVWLAGPVVHWHRCTDACYSYQPGWYPLDEALAILAKLPADDS